MKIQKGVQEMKLIFTFPFIIPNKLLMQKTLYAAIITRKAMNIPGEGHAYLELHKAKSNS